MDYQQIANLVQTQFQLNGRGSKKKKNICNKFMKQLHYTFSVEHAEKYGLNEAIMLHNFIYWLNINRANNNNYINGRYWTYNSSKAFQKLFPFWTQKQIEYTLAKLVDANILIKDCFNQDKRDRTAWYTLSDNFFSECISEKKEMPTTNLGNVISEKKEMYNITDKKQQIKNTDLNNITTASGSSFNENSTISKMGNVQTTYQGNLDNSTGKESLTVESVADKSYILNTQEKDCESWPKSAKKHHILTEQTAENGVNTNEIGWPKNSGYSVEFEEFWEQWGLMCKEKGSATGTKKEAYNEWQKAYKICGHQGIMRVLGVFIEYILIAYGSNKHAGRWFKIIEWKDIDTVINDYKTQAENIMKQKRPQQKPNQINLANIARNNVATVEMLTKIQEEKENFKPVSNLFCD